MSDLIKTEEHLKSLDVTPDKEAKARAKAAFLDKAEEIVSTGQNAEVKKAKRKSRKKAILCFAAGMAAMLIMFVGIRAAYSPAFLTGTITAGGDQIYYRVFPAEVDAPALDDASPYTGELVLLPCPGQEQAYAGNLTACDGKTLLMDDYMSLLSVISGQYGLDWATRSFSVPDYAAVDGFQYCLFTDGAYPYYDENSQVIVNDEFQYVAADFFAYAENADNPQNRYGFYLGEIVLLYTAEWETMEEDLLPCEGQTLKSADYPGLAVVLGVTGDHFTLPDLRNEAPVEGAAYFISLGGEIPFISAK